MRLNRFLALSGVASRRASEAIIAAGRVRVNGETATSPATFVNADRDVVECDGAVVRPDAPRRSYILHKPAGVHTTLSDPHGRSTIAGLLPPRSGRLYPAGRLDAETTGLVLLTDDGDLAHRVMHPKHRLPKRYLVLVRRRVGEGKLRALTSGVSLEDGEARALGARRLASDGEMSVLEIVLGEGRKRQVRRMCGAIGHPVEKLHRFAIGPLMLTNVPEGRLRPLTAEEVRSLRRALALGDP